LVDERIVKMLRVLTRSQCGAFPFIFLLALGVGDATSVAAQLRYPVNVSAGTHSLTVPWHPGPVTDRLNPAVVVGAERTWKPGDPLRLYHTVNLGVFQHYWWMTGVFLDAELGVGYELPLGFHTDLRLGVGYLHYFWRRESLELKDGVYVQARDWGKPSLMVPLTLMLGYRGSPTHPLTVAPFVSAQWAAQALFLDEIPVMTHFFLAVGVRIDLGRSTQDAGR
jgi:hypothetical protein